MTSRSASGSTLHQYLRLRLGFNDYIKHFAATEINVMTLKCHQAKAMNADSEEENSSNSVSSSKPEEDGEQPRGAEGKGSDTTSYPSSTTATTSQAKAVANHPTSQLPTLSAAAAEAAPPVSQSKKKKPRRRAGFREQFLQQVRIIHHSLIHHMLPDPTLTIFVILFSSI